MSLLGRVAAFLKREPALLVTAAGDAASIGADFGLHLTTSQQRGLYGLASAVTAIVIRQTVTPNSKVPSGASLAVDQRLAVVEAAISELAASAAGQPKISS